MSFRVLSVLTEGYGLGLAIAVLATLWGAGPLASVLIFWLGGAVLSLALPLLTQERSADAVPVRVSRQP